MIFSICFAVAARAEEAPELLWFVVDEEQSRVFAYVQRAGLMRRAGHDHVIASESVSGFLHLVPDGSGSMAEMSAPFSDLVVDDPVYRERFGLDPDVSESSIRGTTRNMLEKVLHASEFPGVHVEAKLIDTDRSVAEVTMSMHGESVVYEVPVDLTMTAETLQATGSFTIKHTDFGMRPFRAAAGLLRVADEVDIHFEIVGILKTD